MPMTVPPKSATTRQRRNRRVTTATIEARSATKPALPDGLEWHPQALATWDTWWASPMVAEWVDADVPDLIALVLLVNRFWQATDPSLQAKLHGEIRMAQMQFGLTPMSRRSLQWEIKRVEEQRPTVQPPTRQRDPRLRSVG